MAQEIDYKVKFADKYFKSSKNCDFDLNYVDLILKDSKNKTILYIESKETLINPNSLRQARAQIILTNKKQTNILSQVALIYKDKDNNDILELIKCDDSVMFNNDINWKSETPSNPTKDAIDRINDRLTDNITTYKNSEIKELYQMLLAGENEINITLENCILVYSEWKNSVKFENEIKDEQDLINLFLVDMLNGTKYKQTIREEIAGKNVESQKDLIREGTNLNNYDFTYNKNGEVQGIIYKNKQYITYAIKHIQHYKDFWRKYHRPPNESEFLKILEHSARLYSDAYRKNTGGEYTPSCFVELQNKILKEHYDLNEFLVFDPCAGVGNLENQFGKDFKDSCYLGTLEQMDVDICKIKGFDNAVQFDYLKDSSEPLFKHNGKERTINEICKIENKKLMVIMNPPYQNVKGKKNNLAIEFFNKVCKLNPQVIVFYYMTESFLRSKIEHYIKSGYKIISHIFSDAKTTFLLSNWSISQVIFDKDKGKEVNKIAFSAKRYELESNKKNGEQFNFIKTYTYDLKRPNLLDEIDKAIKENQNGMIVGYFSYQKASINLTNKLSISKNYITTQNLKYCLLSKGLIFNTHNKYFERNQYIFKGTINEIPQELFSDSIAFSLFYLNCAFTNKFVENSGGGGAKAA